MENPKRYDLKISGIGNSTGGIFNNVVIDGVGKIDGDVDCDSFNINGVGSVKGSLKAKAGKTNGTCRIGGDLQTDELKINGNADIGGSIKAKEASFEGMVGINGDVTADTFDNKGVITVKGDLNSEVFISKGAFKIGGLLNAGNIDVNLYAPCRAREIGGEKVQVNMGRSFSIMKLIKAIFPVLDINTGLFTETIEGDEIYLENTKAKVVRGNKVTIGEGCEIELVEYKDIFEESGKSVVRANKKLG